MLPSSHAFEIIPWLDPSFVAFASLELRPLVIAFRASGKGADGIGGGKRFVYKVNCLAGCRVGKG